MDRHWPDTLLALGGVQNRVPISSLIEMEHVQANNGERHRTEHLGRELASQDGFLFENQSEDYFEKSYVLSINRIEWPFLG